MIFDRVSNWKIYFKDKIFEEIFEKLNKINIDTPNGIHFKSTNYYFKVMSYKTQLEPVIIESHRKEVDIQILLSGGENIKIYDSNNVDILESYSEFNDSEFYTNSKNENAIISLKPEFMAVFLPQDIHAPLYALNSNPQEIKKIVIKVDEKFFS